MKTLKITLKGISPLLMNSSQVANPLHPIAKEKAKFTSKHKKTEEDHLAISDLDWEGALYWKDGIGLYLPGENIEAMLVAGGKQNKKGTDIKKYVMVTEAFIPLEIRENLTKEQLKADYRFRDVRQMSINKKSRITRTRARFDTWGCCFTLMYDEEKIDVDTILIALEFAGQYVGLCDSRPKYGKFTSIVEEVA